MKIASLTTTTQSPKETFAGGNMHLSIESLLYSVTHTLNFVGIHTLPSFASYAAFNLDDKKFESIIQEYHDYLDDLL